MHHSLDSSLCKQLPSSSEDLSTFSEYPGTEHRRELLAEGGPTSYIPRGDCPAGVWETSVSQEQIALTPSLPRRAESDAIGR